MNRQPRLPILLSVLLMVVCSPLHGQEDVEYSAQAEQIFSKTMELFNEGRYAEAAAGFDRIVRMMAPHHRTTASYIMRAKALLRIDEPLEAARTLRNFMALYPSSSYLPDADYTMGLVYLKIQRYDDAAQSFLAAWRSDGAVRQSALDALDRMFDTFFSPEAMRTFLDQSHSVGERAFLWLKIGEKAAAEGRMITVGTVLDTLYRNYPATPFSSRIALLRMRMEQRSNVKLGALLPLMKRSDPSAIKELGTDIFDGIQFAIEEYSRDSTARIRVTLETRDSERDALVAMRGVQELSSDNDIIGILGPVFSHEAVAVASLANTRGYPLISPTANANGIAATGQYIFQANPDYESRGRAMARYAVQKKGYRILAVLAPINTFGKFMAEAFAAEALHLGAKVVAMEWYERGVADLKSQMGGIRRAGMKAGAEPMIPFDGKMSRDDIARLVELGVPMSTIDSLMHISAVVSASTLLGPEARQRIDSLGFATYQVDPKVDSLEYPVTALDGIYVPISSAEEIGIVSSQLMYFNIKCQILGSGEWNNLTELIANKRYCNSVIFESDNFVDPANPSMQRFASRYVERFKKKPGKNALYGYDTAMLTLWCIRNGATSRETLMNALKNIKDYQGVHSKLGFSDKRVNTWMWMLLYENDRIRPVEEFNLE